jgi:hypothetical protein
MRAGATPACFAATGCASRVAYSHLSEHIHACAQVVWGVGGARAQARAPALDTQVLSSDAAVPCRPAPAHARDGY